MCLIRHSTCNVSASLARLALFFSLLVPKVQFGGGLMGMVTNPYQDWCSRRIPEARRCYSELEVKPLQVVWPHSGLICALGIWLWHMLRWLGTTTPRKRCCHFPARQSGIHMPSGLCPQRCHSNQRNTLGFVPQNKRTGTL